MLSTQLSTTGVHESAPEVAAIAIQASDFQFVDYPDPNKYFRADPRPFRVIESPPSLAMYNDAIYTPATRAFKPFTGTIYDSELKRVEAARVFRRRGDVPQDEEPLIYEGNPSDLPHYEQPLLYLGRMANHYGHFFFETLSSWWPLVENIGEFDRFLIHTHDPAILDRSYVKAFLSAAGLNKDQLVFFDKPTMLKSVLVPAPAFQMYSHIYTKYRAILNRLAETLGGADVVQTDQPVYISRSLLNTGLNKYQGEEKLEAYLESRGVRIVHPQQLPFPEQVKLYNQHRRIIGITGSGMHNSVLALEPRRLVYLTPRSPNVNAFLTDKCYEADSTYILATKNTAKVKLVTGKLRKKVLGKGKRTDGFRQVNELDHQRLIDWFESSGIL